MRTLALALILSTAAAPALAQQAAPSARAAGLRYLTWPGKVQGPTRQQAQPPAPRPPAAFTPMAAPSAPAPMAMAPAAPAYQPQAAQAAPVRSASWSYRPVQHGQTHFLGELTPAQAAAIDRQRAADRETADRARAIAEAETAKAEAQQKQAEIKAAPLPQPALPNSIYAAPPPAQAAQAAPAGGARIAAAGGYDQQARFYSLHRSYGEKPDPVALSPQFLATPSADLADPPPPPAPRILPGQTATAAQQTAARVAAREASSSE